jgi:ABC-type phosphate transport system ATPase subunit
VRTDEAPYPGLRPFKPSETEIFFGRDECIDTMLSRLAATRFLAVLGSSGIGKSSLVQTGLLSSIQMGCCKAPAPLGW